MLIRDRFKNAQERELIEPRRPVRKRKRRVNIKGECKIVWDDILYGFFFFFQAEDGIRDRDG